MTEDKKAKETKVEKDIIDQMMENVNDVVEEVPKAQVLKIGDKKATANLNKFDVFFIRIWAFICSFVLKISDWICAGLKFIFKKPIPRRYVAAFVAVLLITILVLIIVLPFSINMTRAKDLELYSSGLIAVKQARGIDNTTGETIYKWGYANKKGKMIISPTYDDAMGFKYKVAFVKCSKTENNRTYTYWKLINTKGKNVGELEFPMNGDEVPVFQFSDDTKLARVKLTNNYGFINSKGKWAIEAEYDEAGDFINGLARVGKNSSFWFINKKGKQVSSQYTAARDFVEGYAAVKTNGGWGFINAKCESICENKYYAVSDFYCGYAAVRMGDSYGIIDKKGNPVVKTNQFYDMDILNYFNIGDYE